MIDYKLLEAFAMVVQEGGFEKAANLLNLTQSAISQRVKLLEDRSGKILLTRSTPPLPTEAGELLVKHYLQVKLLEDGLAAGLGPDEADEPVRLSVGVNADSLANWFLPAIGPLFADGQVLIDLHVDDQEQTHRFLKEGIVVGCISDRAAAIQGCRVEYLGKMIYRLLARPDFIEKWFPDGLTQVAVKEAPAVIFSRKDMLHHKFLRRVLKGPVKLNAYHYVPATEQYMQMISEGYAYGMVPDWQSEELQETGELVDIHAAEHDAVKLYWHCWNLDSAPLQEFSDQLVKEAKQWLD
jgi:LysR family transcriptional regulator (chromosome initiation inhibitor)